MFTTWLAKATEVGERLAFGPSPVPLSGAVCGLPGALSAMESAAVRKPDAEGVNVTLMLQLAPAARLVPQVVVRAKFAALVPVIVMLVMVMLAVPVFVSVTRLGLLAVLTA